jgi:hypothetical protein
MISFNSTDINNPLPTNTKNCFSTDVNHQQPSKVRRMRTELSHPSECSHPTGYFFITQMISFNSTDINNPLPTDTKNCFSTDVNHQQPSKVRRTQTELSHPSRMLLPKRCQGMLHCSHQRYLN